MRSTEAVQIKRFGIAGVGGDGVGDGLPAGLDLHLVLDNYAAHKAPAVRRWLGRHPRFHLHFIPKHSSRHAK